MTNNELKNNSQNRTLKQWLFNPFQFIAGGNALFLGLVIMLAAAFLGSLGDLHFDGVIDLHIGKPAPLWFFIAEVLIDWLCLSIVLLIAAFFVSRSSFRIIDVFGTQALARTPYLAALLVIMPKGFNRFAEYLAAKGMQQPTAITIESTDVLLFIVGIVVVLSMLVWMVALMYRAYSVSCNTKGGKAIISFIAGLIIAEILSIVSIWQLALRTGLR
jgi:uncharacterized membrane protein